MTTAAQPYERLLQDVLAREAKARERERSLHMIVVGTGGFLAGVVVTVGVTGLLRGRARPETQQPAATSEGGA